MSPALERRLGVGAVVAGLAVLVVAVEQRWTTVPGRFTANEADVDLPGSVLFEIGRLYALLATGALVWLLRSKGGSRRAAGAVVAVVGVLALSQGLDAALDPGKWVVMSDDGLRRLGLDELEGRSAAEDLRVADLPTTPWALAAVAGTVLLIAGGGAVAARGRRWDDAAPGPAAAGWRTRA